MFFAQKSCVFRLQCRQKETERKQKENRKRQICRYSAFKRNKKETKGTLCVSIVCRNRQTLRFLRLYLLDDFSDLAVLSVALP